MPTYRAEAVVLRARDIGEADKLLTLFARGHGKIRAVARGARRTKSRLVGGTQLFARVEASLWVGRSLDGISQCQVLQSNRACREDLVSFGCASYAAEIVDVMARERDPNDAAYESLTQGLGALCGVGEAARAGKGGISPSARGGEGSPAPEDAVTDWRSAPASRSEVATLWMAITFLRAFGYAPEMRCCAGCGKPLETALREAPKRWRAGAWNAEEPRSWAHGKAAFDPGLGGLVCTRCWRPGNSLAVSPATVEAFVALSACSSPEAALLERVSREGARGVVDVVEEHLAFHIERRLKSSVFFRSVVEEESPGDERDIRSAW